LLRLRDRHGLSNFLGAALQYGVYDLRGTPSVRLWGDRPLVLNTPMIDWFVDQYAPPEVRGDPDVSPLLADLRSLPPALFSVGTEDPLLDDTLFLAARWRAAGNEADLRVYPGAPHSFDTLPLPVGQEATGSITHFLAQAAGR
jgi:acetyl esterase/lipase